MRKVKIGLIGCGVISRVYLQNIRDLYHQLEVVACADLLAEKAAELAEQFKLPLSCKIDELLENPEVELVLNLTVPAAHAEINRLALEAGKHVYCEKPLALTLEQAVETAKLARERGLLLGCAPDTFLGAGLQTCRRVIDDGWIGTPVSATANMVSHGVETWHANPEFYYRQGGGPMLDMGPYYLTGLVSLLGSVRELFGFSGQAFRSRRIYSHPLRGKLMEVEVPTHYSGVMDFESGVIANINMSFDIWGSGLPQLEIYGTEGTLILPNPNWFGGSIRLLRGETVLDLIEEQKLNGEENANIYLQYSRELPQFYQQPRENMRGLGLQDMAFALAEGRTHRTEPQLACHVTEAMLGFLKSAEEGKPYRMSSSCRRPEPMPQGLYLL